VPLLERGPKSVLHVELGVAPKARIDRIGRWPIDADKRRVRIQVPNHATLGVRNDQRFGFANQTAPRIFELRLQQIAPQFTEVSAP